VHGNCIALERLAPTDGSHRGFVRGKGRRRQRFLSLRARPEIVTTSAKG
jgi:hypothetical protein